ncbi:MAG TPA: TSUP family transporter, partial [Anaerolineaceae bacterium]|nr:TSUP family transporter [Anaerolineaceae bacterium]
LLVGRGAKWDVVVRFALPGAAAAILGAALLNAFAELPNLYTYALGGQNHNISLLKVIIAAIIIFLAIFDLVPAWSGFAFEPRYLPFGGMLSGFLGGLSGQQGLLRAAFLIKLGLSKEAFIGTSVMTAVIVDIARLMVYGISFYSSRFQLIQGEMLGLVVAGSLAAFAGAWIGARFMHKVTLRGVQVLVSVMLIAIGLALGIGLI